LGVWIETSTSRPREGFGSKQSLATLRHTVRGRELKHCAATVGSSLNAKPEHRDLLPRYGKAWRWNFPNFSRVKMAPPHSKRPRDVTFITRGRVR
jgi:hypothetical protein